jgi:hypothetical protein
VAGAVLSLEAGPLCGVSGADVVYAAGDDGALPGLRPVSPSPNAAGGFDAWTPLPELPPRSAIVITLQP